ncbi:MAG: hypothetical protein HQM09_11100, partial [Candidatus Riflebacteria bacterium]|nr:hypothetical protein [Candidatus Riflebacteria bacterium]
TTESGATVWVNGNAATVVGTNWSYSMALPTEGANAISVVAKDALLNTSNPVTSSITKDTTAPAVTLSAVTTPTSVTPQTISGTTESGATVWVNGNAATVVGTNWSYSMALVVGANAISVVAKDALLNTSNPVTSSITRASGDTIPPVTSVTNGVVPGQLYDPYCTLVLGATDNSSGVAHTYVRYTFDAAVYGWQEVTLGSPNYISWGADGNTYNVTVAYYSTDVAGNSETPKSISFQVYTAYVDSSCPVLYVWNGENYANETDMAPLSFLGIKTPKGFQRSNPYEYRLLANTPQIQNDSYTFKIHEEQDETDYLDNVKLYTLDYPADRDIFAEMKISSHRDPATVVHTVAKTLRKPLSIKHVNDGEDVTAKLTCSDKDYLVLSKDRNLDFDWQTLEIDFGDLSNAPQIKLIVDAYVEPVNTPAGQVRRRKLIDANGKHIRLEVPDASGKWTRVTNLDGGLPKTPDACNAYIQDISKIFINNNYKLRLSFLHKAYVDSILFDTTLDQPVVAREVPFVSANLGYYGFSVTPPGEMPHYTYGIKNTASYSHYFTGDYTQYGDVTPLLSQTDDKFVIFGGGDEINVTFGRPSPQPEGKSRRYMVYADLYFKSTANTDVAHNVEPLPFASMTTYPYTTPETYPTDAEHAQYRQKYNTRHFSSETLGFPIVPTDEMIKRAAREKAYDVAIKGIPTGVSAPETHLSGTASLPASPQGSAICIAGPAPVSGISVNIAVETPAMTIASIVSDNSISLACSKVSGAGPVKYQFIRYEQVITPYRVGRNWTTLCSGDTSEDNWFESASQDSDDIIYGYSYRPAQYSALFDTPSGTMDGIPDGDGYYAVQAVDAKGVYSKISAIINAAKIASR